MAELSRPDWPAQPVVCACCGEHSLGYADNHPFDPHARDPWSYRGSGNWNCPFCFDVCRGLDRHGSPSGHVEGAS